MKWQNVIYTDGYENLTRRTDGKSSKFAQTEIDGCQYLIKVLIIAVTIR